MTIVPDLDHISRSIAQLFEDARQRREAEYDPSRFLAHLTDPPALKGRRVADTFAGRRRYVRFMQSVELTHGICFTNKEWENAIGRDEFVRLVAEKSVHPETALRLAERRLQEARSGRLFEPVKFGVFTAFLGVGAVMLSNPIVRLAIMGIWLSIVISVATLTEREYRHARRLVERIRQNLRGEPLQTKGETTSPD